MTLQLSALSFTGGICLIVSLMEAWCLTGIRHLNWGWSKRLFPSDQNLLKSHLDYLMMSMLLFGGAALLHQWGITVPAVVLWAACIGSLLNPFGFLLMAINPGLMGGGNAVFSGAMALSFLLTTIGYVGISVCLMMASWSV